MQILLQNNVENIEINKQNDKKNLKKWKRYLNF